MAGVVEISRRESEVLDLLAARLSNAEIAAQLTISVRTVESHVAALLRKLDAPDRRSLARRVTRTPGTAPVLPAPLTSFVGRSAERAELAGLLTTNRQVTAAGPGGVGKTRLALAVAADAAGNYRDGVRFVDLVPVTDAALVPAALAEALGLGEQPGRDLVTSIVQTMADRQALLVLDNCEHVLDGVTPLLERLLSQCPRITVLATSRVRLMVPFERVYQVPALSLTGDAVALFLERAAAVGWPLDAPLRDQVAGICERLGGMALAIELAAARYPALGLDGITAALSHPLRMLTGGSRTDERHRSVRATLDWSHALLEPDDQVLLRRVSVFVAPFTAAAAQQVTGLPDVVDSLAKLTEHSLLTATPTHGTTKYRALESIRQYAVEKLCEAGEEAETRLRHARWCLGQAAALSSSDPEWRARFDLVANDLRAALTWAATDRPATAYELARRLAELTLRRNLTRESQQRAEQAAELAPDTASKASMLRFAAGVAGCRTVGEEMYRLHLAAAETGDAPAVGLATAATVAFRFSSTFVHPPSRAEAVELIDRARPLAGSDPAAGAALALAEAAVLTDAFGAVQGPEENDVSETIARAERAVELAHRTGDPLAESAALDALTCAHSWGGDTFAPAALTQRRLRLLASVPSSPAATHELIDALGIAVETSLGAGDIAGARDAVHRLATHPALTEVGHRVPLMVDALAGNADAVLDGSLRFIDAWRRAGSPSRNHLGPSAAAVAMIHGLRGEDEARREWLEIVGQLDRPDFVHGYKAIFDAIVLLHHGHAAEAMQRLGPRPEEVWKWITWIWHHWYVALRAEAAVLSGRPDASGLVAEALTVVRGNPVAAAIAERARALLDDDRSTLLATADAQEAAGCPYQAARSRVLAGDADAAAALVADGFAPMATPP
ncbi:putative ATPase [Kribbella jejuensis]|uniref:Putative ATPase n=1 Tax=Kribbella jejuensis TaxID=236068 RepID=A0A542EAQ8_9ACTN|nr:putative ATPase [Kribbella jejuensis]